MVFSYQKNLPLRYFFQSSSPFSSQGNILFVIVSFSTLTSFNYFSSKTIRSFFSVFAVNSVICWITLFSTRCAQPILFETLESTRSIVSLTPSTTVLCYQEISLRASLLTYYLVSTTGAVFRFFLKFRPWLSSTVVASTLLETLLPLGKNLALLFRIEEFYSDILASFKLEILRVGFAYSINPSLFIFNWNNYIQPILWWGSLVNILEIIPLRVGEMLAGNDKFCVLTMELDWKGQCPNTISQSTTPSDQMSALMEYIYPFNTSGAMQMGEPSIVFAMSSAEPKFLQKPKSPNLMTPLWKNILSGFISLCMILYLFKIWKASSSCLNICSAFCSDSFFSLASMFSRVPPLQNSQMKQKLLVVFNMSQYLIICWFDSMLLRIFIQLTVHSSSFLFYLNLAIGITLIAYSFLSVLLMALYTLPYTPDPMISQSAQFSMYLTMGCTIFRCLIFYKFYSVFKCQAILEDLRY